MAGLFLIISSLIPHVGNNNIMEQLLKASVKTFNISIHNIQKHDYISILNFLSWILHFLTKKLKCIKNIRSAEECNTLHAALNVLAKFMRQLEFHCLLMELVNAYCRISYDVFSTYIK